jgi:hypothetical protein
MYLIAVVDNIEQDTIPSDIIVHKIKTFNSFIILKVDEEQDYWRSVINMFDPHILRLATTREALALSCVSKSLIKIIYSYLKIISPSDAIDFNLKHFLEPYNVFDLIRHLYIKCDIFYSTDDKKTNTMSFINYLFAGTKQIDRDYYQQLTNIDNCIIDDDAVLFFKHIIIDAKPFDSFIQHLLDYSNTH